MTKDEIIYTWEDIDKSFWRGFDTAKNKIEKRITELEKACHETQELLDKQIEVTYKLDKENAELKERLSYAKAIMRELLDNSNEYAKQNAEDFIKVLQ